MQIQCSWLSFYAWLVIMFVSKPVHFVEARLLSQPYVHNMNIIKQRLEEMSTCQDSCIFTLVESIPDNLTYSPGDPMLMSTYAAHKRLLQKANQSIHLASFYWTLTSADLHCPDNSSFQDQHHSTLGTLTHAHFSFAAIFQALYIQEGEDIFQSLLSIVKGGKIEVKITQNITSNDTETLAKLGAQVRTVDMVRLVHAGVMHTKMWIVDGSHVYIGSGNFDWRSYTQTKETGALIENCPCLATDADKLFEVYWYLGVPNATIPAKWPDEYNTDINESSPALVHYNDTKGYVYLSSSPPPFCPSGRSRDLDAVLNVIMSAKKFIFISVMDYFPMYIYSNPRRFWPVIDDALRRAAIDHHVHVCLMASQWNHTAPYMKAYLKSLYSLNLMPKLNVNLQVKLFTVPSSAVQETIPFARVSHSKYMVTDKHAYIGTSNWSGDYFKSTGGVAFILEQPEDGRNGTSLRAQLTQIFMRDWNSTYAQLIA